MNMPSEEDVLACVESIVDFQGEIEEFEEILCDMLWEHAKGREDRVEHITHEMREKLPDIIRGAKNVNKVCRMNIFNINKMQELMHEYYPPEEIIKNWEESKNI